MVLLQGNKPGNFDIINLSRKMEKGSIEQYISVVMITIK